MSQIPQKFCSYPRRNRIEFGEPNDSDSNDGDGEKIKIVGTGIFRRDPQFIKFPPPTAFQQDRIPGRPRERTRLPPPPLRRRRDATCLPSPEHIQPTDRAAGIGLLLQVEPDEARSLFGSELLARLVERLPFALGGLGLFFVAGSQIRLKNLAFFLPLGPFLLELFYG